MGAEGSDAHPWYAFNDLHAVMALVGAGRIADAARVVERARRLRAPRSSGHERGDDGRDRAAGVPRRGRLRPRVAYDDVIAELLPIRRVLQHFGGSHAQRDALQRTLLESALRDGQLPISPGR